MNDGTKIIAGFVALVGVIFLLTILFGSFFILDSGERGVLLTWGQAKPQSIEPGLHFKVPIAQDIVKFDVKTQIYGADASANTYDSAASKDLQVVKANIAVNYHVDPDTVPELYSKVGTAYEPTVITPAVHDALKATTAEYTAAELITKREEVRAGIQEKITNKLRPYHISVESVNIVKFDFSDQFNTAIENKVTAEQQKEKAVNDLARIQVEAQQQVAQANGARDAAIAQATGEATKVRLVQEQLRQSPNYVNYIAVQRWNGVLPWFTGTSATSLVDFRSVTNMATLQNNSSGVVNVT